MKKIVCLIGLFVVLQTFAQSPIDSTYFIQIKAPALPVQRKPLLLGTNKNPQGVALDINSMAFLKNGKPWYPIMGELHFSRVPKELWEASILKMKACGIDIIATYVFWIYHEEEAGVWRWDGERNIAAFLQLCAKHHMYVWLRIGPWCHGEVRNGGFPDWLLKLGKTRSNDSVYLQKVRVLYSQVHQQANPYYYKNGGPIIGVQIENEFRFNHPKGLAHMLALKQMAVQTGIDVPYYSATGWPGSDVQQKELLPVWGAYAEAPWDKRTTELPLSENYVFSPIKNDGTIGNDLVASQKDSAAAKAYPFPYATAEMGAGIQVTHHRRPLVTPQDVIGLAITKLGAGANLMGYYMFHGGRNDIGINSTLQESKTTKYPNDYAIIDYSFQAPLGTWGEPNESYAYFKRLHYFLNSFGQELAQCNTYFPKQKINKSNTQDLRWAVRANQTQGFVCINQYQRQLSMQAVPQVQFTFQWQQQTIRFPEKPITIPANTQAIWPFNFPMGKVQLYYATAQPITQVNQHYYFFAQQGIQANYCFDATAIQSITASHAKITKQANKYFIEILQPSKATTISLVQKDGKQWQITTLSAQESLQFYTVTLRNKTYCLLSNATLYSKGNTLQIESLGKDTVALTVLHATPNWKITGAATTLQQKQQHQQYQLLFKTHASKPQIQPMVAFNNTAAQLPTDTATKFFPLYDTVVKAVKNAQYFALDIASTTKGFLQIHYAGDAFALYKNNRLVADDFFYGQPMKYYLPQAGQQQLTGVLLPFVENQPIYFQPNSWQNKQAKNSLTQVAFIPQYTATIE